MFDPWLFLELIAAPLALLGMGLFALYATRWMRNMHVTAPPFRQAAAGPARPMTERR